ncbi:MAG: class I SAM-dependent methyltransferase [Nitrospinota bacterium]|nr:MAG: class I SAM-dependent methyltransferase [Nitrospinota bacterium]
MPDAGHQSDERLFPQKQWRKQDQYLLFLRQLFAYRYAETHVYGKRVLDLGCGAGHGITLLAQKARMAVGMDKDLSGLLFARQQAGSALPLSFVAASGYDLPFAEHSFDLVLSFQVLEHLHHPQTYLQAIKRILTPTGMAIFTTPNRRLRLLPFQSPWNHYHVREYDWRALRRLLHTTFPRVQLLGITATADIVELERRRVQQDPWLVYGTCLRNSLENLLPSSLTRRLDAFLEQRQSQKVSRLRAIQSSFSRSYTVSDYRVTEDDLKGCLDLLACCWPQTENATG